MNLSVRSLYRKMKLKSRMSIRGGFVYDSLWELDLPYAGNVSLFRMNAFHCFQRNQLCFQNFPQRGSLSSSSKGPLERNKIGKTKVVRPTCCQCWHHSAKHVRVFAFPFFFVTEACKLAFCVLFRSRMVFSCVMASNVVTSSTLYIFSASFFCFILIELLYKALVEGKKKLHKSITIVKHRYLQMFHKIKFCCYKRKILLPLNH